MDNRTERFHFGAFPKSDGVYFSVWAPEAKTVEISFYEPKDFSLENSKPIKTISLTKKEQEKGAGVWELLTKEVKSGALYKYTVDGKGPFPDPSSRFQPHGVHGPSQVIDPTAFKWNDQDWTNRLKDPKSRSFAADLIIYELHIGTFTKEGTYKSAQQKLDYLKELGITAIEILPLSDFPGRWNWGYDGVMLYSPARCYGDPDELREFIDAAHSKGLYVLLDAVYNHFGPDGNYTGCYSPYYFTEKHHTPWGPAPNIDLSLGKDKSSPEYMNALQVRRFLIENGIYWIEEFHFDGFRLDATHALVDNSTPHFLLEFVQSCNNNVLGKNVFVFAEDDRNSTLLLKEPMEGYGLDGAWADDFHHQVRVNLAGDRESYFANFTGETKDLAKTIKQGWFYTGQLCGEEHRGTDPTIIPLMSKFSYCIQNHDQIGNRAFGDRLNHKISGNAYKVASALVLLVPQTPLLFMGQEFSSKSPFQFFTDHNESLGKLVTEGRRKEFAKFSAFNDPQLREKIPDPQAESTFVNSKLNFDEISMKEHKNIFEFYKKLIAFRKSEDALKNCERSQFDVVDLSESAIGLLRKSNQKSVLAIFNFNGNSVINLDEALTKLGANSKKLTIAFTSDDDLYRLENDSAPVVTLEEGKQQIQFNGPSVVVFYL